MNHRLLTTGSVAEIVEISEATVKRWADSGMLPCIRTPGGHRKFRVHDVAMHLAMKRTPSKDRQATSTAPPPSSAPTAPSEPTAPHEPQAPTTPQTPSALSEPVATTGSARVEGAHASVVNALLAGDTMAVVGTIKTLRSSGLTVKVVVDTVLHPAFDEFKKRCDPSRCKVSHVNAALCSLVELAILQRPGVGGASDKEPFVFLSEIEKHVRRLKG